MFKRVCFFIISFLFISLFVFANDVANNNVSKVFVIKKLEFQEVNRWYSSYIKKGLEKAKEEGATLIILELDTPGGLVASALEIKNYLISSEIPVVTFINKNALSAGALISLSTDAIYMSFGSIIGAATPIYLKDGKIEKASEKEVSAMRAAMRSSAERIKKNVRVAEAFVDESITLTEKDDGINLDNKTLLTLSTDEAIKVKIADGVANSISDIIKLRGLSEQSVITTISEEKYDFILRFLISPAVLSVLISIGLIGAFIELKTPGFGLGGIISILAFSIFFFAQVFVGESSYIAPAVFIIGVILIALEIFVIPGFGIAGVLGIVGIFTSIFMSFGVNNFKTASLAVFFAIVISIVIMIILARFMSKSKSFSNHLALNTDTANYHSSVSYDFLLGRDGIADTFLRPSGNVIIDDVKYDVISDGAFIDKGKRVKVVLVEGSKIVVRELNA